MQYAVVFAQLFVLCQKIRNNELKNYTNLVNYCIIRNKENDAAGMLMLFDIIEAVEGQTELQRCLHDVGSCSKGCSGMCSIYAAFAGIQRNLAKQLKSYNFEDLANQEKAIKNAEEAAKVASAPDEDKAKAE